MQNLRQQRQQLAQAVRASDERKAWTEFLTQHREIVPCEANWRITVEYFNGDELTLFNLEEALPGLQDRLALRSEADERRTLTEEITALLTGSQSAIDSVTARFKYQSVEELRQQLETLRARRAARSMTVPQLKEVVRKSIPAPAQLPVEYTRSELLRIIRENLSKFKSLMKRYGTQLDTRLQTVEE